jgi:hypothetical protein
MSNGYGPVCSVPATTWVPDGSVVENVDLGVREWWTSSEDGVELGIWKGKEPARLFISVSREEAVQLAALLVEAAGEQYHVVPVPKVEAVGVPRPLTPEEQRQLPDEPPF